MVCTQNAIYTPSTGYSGPDSFTYKANDGAADSNLATATIDVLVPPNSPPTATGQSQTVGFNQPKLITLAGSDTDSAALTFAIVSPPARGTLTIGATSCVPSGGGSSCTQAVTYTPNAGQTGADSFSFKVNDGTSDSAPATVTLNILNAPDRRRAHGVAADRRRGAEHAQAGDAGRRRHGQRRADLRHRQHALARHAEPALGAGLPAGGRRLELHGDHDLHPHVRLQRPRRLHLQG